MVAFVLFLACAKPVPPETSADAPVQLPVAMQVVPPTIPGVPDLSAWDGKPVSVLVDPGAEPRSAMRFQPVVGDRAISQLKSVSRMEIRLLGTSVPSESTLGVVVQTVVLESGDGLTLFECQVLGVDVTGGQAVAEAMQAMVDALTGSVFHYSVDDRGVLVDLDASQVEDAAAREALEQQVELGMGFHFPVEPIGVGAVWDEFTMVERGGLVLVSQARNTLTGLDGTTLTGNTVVQVHLAEEPDMEQMGSPAGFVLTSLESSGGGEWVSDLRALSSETFITSTTSVEMAGVDQEQLIEVGVTLESEMTAVSEPALSAPQPPPPTAP